MLEDLLDAWHERHHKEKSLYYISGFFIPDEAIEMLEKKGYTIPHAGAFLYAIPGEEEDLIKRLKKRFGSRLAIFSSEEIKNRHD